MSSPKPITKSTIFWLSIVSGTLYLLLQLLYWDIIDLVTPFLVLFVEGPVKLFFYTTLVWSLVYFLRSLKRQGLRSLLPLAINIMALIIVTRVPFTEMTLESDFSRNLDARLVVVQKIKTGALVNNVNYNKELIHLPFGYPNISTGGNDIVFEKEGGKLKVFFFTFRGVIDNMAGFIYKEDDTPPTAEDFQCGTLLDSKKYRDNWYWMSCS